jgi:cytochrome b6-f complex iron-sulfur subunit
MHKNIESSDENFQPTRRTFLKTAGLVFGGAALAGVMLESCASSIKAASTAPSMTVDVSGLSSEQTSLVTSDLGPDAAPILIHRKSAGNFEALSMKCTHKGCLLAPPDMNGLLNCPCHGSQFDEAGGVVTGPATEHLHIYATAKGASAGELIVKFK